MKKLVVLVAMTSALSTCGDPSNHYRVTSDGKLAPSMRLKLRYFVKNLTGIQLYCCPLHTPKKKR